MGERQGGASKLRRACFGGNGPRTARVGAGTWWMPRSIRLRRQRVRQGSVRGPGARRIAHLNTWCLTLLMPTELPVALRPPAPPHVQHFSVVILTNFLHHPPAPPGVTTDELDRVVHEAMIERGAYPSPLNYFNFPKSVCTSVNEVGLGGRRPTDTCLLHRISAPNSPVQVRATPKRGTGELAWCWKAGAGGEQHHLCCAAWYLSTWPCFLTELPSASLRLPPLPPLPPLASPAPPGHLPRDTRRARAAGRRHPQHRRHGLLQGVRGGAGAGVRGRGPCFMPGQLRSLTWQVRHPASPLPGPGKHSPRRNADASPFALAHRPARVPFPSLTFPAHLALQLPRRPQRDHLRGQGGRRGQAADQGDTRCANEGGGGLQARRAIQGRGGHHHQARGGARVRGGTGKRNSVGTAGCEPPYGYPGSLGVTVGVWE